MNQLTPPIEALIFASEAPISKVEIKLCLEETFGTSLAENEIENALAELADRYRGDAFAFELVEISGGFRLLTKGAFHPVIATHLKMTTKKKLSQAALETLSIVAYRQPVTKTELEQIRGVNCDYAIQKLLEKELVSISGRSEGPGKPLLYSTSEKFMDYFGIRSLDDLPKLKEFKDPENTIGEQTEEDTAQALDITNQ